MTIKINLTNVDNNATGVNLTAYLANFDANYKAAGYGTFSGADGMSGKQYLTSDAAGWGLVYEAGNAPWAYNMATHQVTGSIDALSFGNGYKVNASSGTFDGATEIRISGLNLQESVAANALRSALTSGSVAELEALLNGSSLNIVGSTGNDVVKGYAKADTISGGNGNDNLSGAGGNDKLWGGAGNDKIYGDSGNDELGGGDGADKLYGGAGNDKLYGGAGNDELGGGAGADKLYGDAGSDKLYGGAGNDVLDGGAGNDILFGGAGSDRFVFASNSGKDVISDFVAGAGGVDVIAFDDAVFGSFAAVKAATTDTADGALISFAGGSVLLEGVTKAQLVASDFDFF